ncbi:MAG: hypothetical protein ACLFQB_06875 [Chitinispirillaceae bacterium]
MHGFEKIEVLDSMPATLVGKILVTSQVTTERKTHKFEKARELALVKKDRFLFKFKPYTNYNNGRIVYFYSCVRNSVPVTVFVNDNGFIHILTENKKEFSMHHSSLSYNRMERIFLFRIKDPIKKEP